MSRRSPRSHPWFRRSLQTLAAACALGVWACSGGGGGKPAAPVSEGQALYNQGQFAAALPHFLKEGESGRRDGTLLYQIGFLREMVEAKNDERDRLWQEAEPLLEKEIAAPGGADLERLYYLCKINAVQGDFERVRQYGAQAVEQFEKGPNPNGPTGEDWFRLGRVHDLMGEVSEAEACYRRAVSDFTRAPSAIPVFHALALQRVADLDYGKGRYAQAAAGYDQALKILPTVKDVRPFDHAIALLAAGRFEQAVARFGEDRDEQTTTESQYGADLARKAKEVQPLDDTDRDGAPIGAMSYEVLSARIKEAAADYRKIREKNSYRPGDPLTAELAQYQKRFVILMREHLVRQKQVQDFCLHEGIADLVRR